MTANPGGGVVENPTDFMLAPGEDRVYGDLFMTSILTPYMKAQLMCSSTRFVYKAPSTLLGVIPLGYNENTVPVSNIASVASNSRFMPGRAVLAAISLFLAYYFFGEGGGGILFALILLAFGAAVAVTAFPMELVVTNPAGGQTKLLVSMLEKTKLETFRSELQDRVFADNAQVRHMDAQDVRRQQAMFAQLQLQQMMMQNGQQQAQQGFQTPNQPGMNGGMPGAMPGGMPGAMPGAMSGAGAQFAGNPQMPFNGMPQGMAQGMPATPQVPTTPQVNSSQGAHAIPDTPATPSASDFTETLAAPDKEEREEPQV